MSEQIKMKLTDNSAKVKKAMLYACRASTRKAGRIVAKEARANAPVKTGSTKKSIAVITRSPKDKQVRSYVGYWSKRTLQSKGKPTSFARASWVENGSRPHRIKAGQRSSHGKIYKRTGKKALSNGTTLFNNNFLHPGCRPLMPLQDAAKAKAGEVKNCAQEYYAKLSDLYKQEDGFFAKIAADAGGEGDVEDDE